MSNDTRIDRVEERLAWLERHVTEQDRAMLELVEQNAQLRKALAEMQSRGVAPSLQREGEPDEDAPPERPPHY